jgi:hypothetical protein
MVEWTAKPEAIAMTTNRVFSNRVPPLLLAALLAGFGCAGDDDDTGTEEGPTCTWEKVYDEQAFSLQGFSADEIYARISDKIIRWDGSSWQPFFDKKEGVQMNVPFIDNERNFYFGSSSECVVWKYGSETWTCLWNGTDDIYSAGFIWGTGAANEIVCSTNGLSSDTAIHEYDPSGTWTEMWSGYADIESIWGRGPDDIYAIGTAFGGTGESRAIHYDGTGWKELPPVPDVDILYGVAGSPDGDTWFVGMVEYGDNTFPFLGRWDGSSWEVVIDSDDVEWDDESHYTGYLTDIHFFDDGKAIAVGWGLVYYFDGAKWWEISGFEGDRVWGVSAQDFHMAGVVDDSAGIFRGSCE